MPVTQPAGAIRSFAFGPSISTVFSPDSSRFYVSDDTGSVSAYDVATGNLLSTWQVGTRLGGMDITPDGRTLVVVEQQPVSAVYSGSDSTIVSAVYKIDVATGARTVFTSSSTAYYPDAPYHDVVALTDGSVMLTQTFYGSGFVPLTRLDLATGSFTDSGQGYAQDGTLTRSGDYERVLFAPSNISDAPLFVLDGVGTVTASHGGYADGVSGFNRGIQAISNNGNIVAQAIGPLHIYNASLGYTLDLSQRYQQFINVSGLAFNPAGTILYILDSNADYVFELSTTSFDVIRGYSIGTDLVNTYLGHFGDTLQASPDGLRISVIGDTALQVIDLATVASDGGTSGNDTLTGNSDRNFLYGFAGNDSLDGRGGDDVMYGNTGDDRFYVDSQSDQVIERAGEGFDEVFTSVSMYIPDAVERITAIEGFAIALQGSDNADTLVGNGQDNSLSGNGGRDILIGGGGNDTLSGGTGNDQMFGGTGNDTFYADSRGDLVFENAGEGTDTILSTVGFYLYANVENLTLIDYAGSIFGVGNELDNILTGNPGDNLLIAGAGNDTLRGNAGDDALFGEDGNDEIHGGAGIDYIVGGSGNDVIDGGDNADAIYGGDGDDTINAGNDFFTDILVGGDGNDILAGNSGLGDYDLLYGGQGNDTYYVDTPADLTFEDVGGGNDTVIARIDGAGYYLYANVENLILDGTTPFGVGNELDNFLTGSASANYLLGGAGNDYLNGRGGNDVLFGEAGADVFVFQSGTGADVIGDYQPGVDRILLTGLGFTSYAQLQSSIFEVAGTTGITLGNGDLIVINGVTNAQLSAVDFAFG